MPEPKTKKTSKKHDSTKVSLDPLSPEEALADLLKVKPPPEKKKRGSEQKQKRRRVKGDG